MRASRLPMSRAAAKVKKPRVVQVWSGSWYSVGTFVQDICCDCGLVHDTEFKVENGRIMFRHVVNRRATDAERAKHGITIKRKL